MPHAEPVELSSNRVLPASTAEAPADPAANTAYAESTPTAVPSTTAPAVLVVDVAGKVHHPGIVELPAGSRVVDALEAAGGPLRGVSLLSLNLARLVVDGEQIVVGVAVPSVPGLPSSGGSTSSTSGASIAPVNLNSATEEQLDALPDVGPVTVQAILQWRADNGPFLSVDDLLEVSGIGEATLDDIRPYVYV